jgi:cytochrome d ubiquinol oxidase subunit I
MIDSLWFARCQMGLSLAFHIVFAVIGMAMPVMMVVAEAAWLRRGDPVYLDLTKRWAKGTAVFFAVGAVSGTVLSFELGLLWPHFMAFAGSIIGMPFSLEGFAFFLEAIFLGIYLYGWNRVSRSAHLFAGVMVAVCGAFSGIFVVSVNAWMNTPAGFQVEGGRVTDVSPLAAMMNPAAAAQVIHMLLAAYSAVGIAVAGVHARWLLIDRTSAFHRRAYLVALAVGLPAVALQPLSGDYAGRVVAATQPAKFAAMEAHFETAPYAPLHLGGIPDPEARVTRYALQIPGGLSLLAHGTPSAVVTGLSDVPADLWPPVLPVHLSFQVMVALGFWLATLSLWGAVLWWRSRLFDSTLFLRLIFLSTPLGFVALEAGWMVTELGRQPWIIQGVMKTSAAVTPMSGLAIPFVLFAVIYVCLGVAVTVLMRHVVLETRPGGA